MRPVTSNALRICTLALLAAAFAGCAEGVADRAAGNATPAASATAAAKGKSQSGGIVKIVKSDAEWRRELTPSQYRVLRQKGTEMAGTGELLNEHRTGVFVCAACNLELFGSGAKFESGSGWPSFYQPIASPNVEEIADDSYGMRRVEVACARCGGHLGHVFDDGPRPTGLRYCINSAALKFEPAETTKASAAPAAKDPSKH